MKYRVKNSNRTAAVIVSLLFTLAVVLFIVSTVISLYRSIVQFGMMISVIAAIIVAERYLISTFEYAIEQNAGEPDLVVYKTTGRKTRAQCRMGLYDADKLVRCVKDAMAPAAVGKLYDYTGSVNPERFVLIFFESENATLKLEPDEEFTLLLERLMRRPDIREDDEED